MSNILEDERVERLMAGEFVGLRALLKYLAQALYREAPALNAESDAPGEVVGCFLQLRWARRIGAPLKGSLSPRNRRLWRAVEPWVYRAWEAESSVVVARCAEEIVRRLGLKEDSLPAWVEGLLERTGSVEGERVEGDVAERGGGGTAPDEASDVEEPQAFDGEVLPNDERAGRGEEAIEPAPYLELEEKVEPLVRELIAELAWEEQPTGLTPAQSGGRLSLREYLRDREHPFLVEEQPRRAPPTLALKVIVDHSTSLNYGSGSQTRMQSIAEAVMALHRVCLALGVPNEVWVTPLIAGLVPARCDYEDMGLALQAHALPMRDAPQEIKLVLCLTDGACNDAALGKAVCRSLRGRVEVIGVLLDPDASSRRSIEEMFGEGRVIACRAEELPQKLGNVLRALRGI